MSELLADSSQHSVLTSNLCSGLQQFNVIHVLGDLVLDFVQNVFSSLLNVKRSNNKNVFTQLIRRAQYELTHVACI